MLTRSNETHTFNFNVHVKIVNLNLMSARLTYHRLNQISTQRPSMDKCICLRKSNNKLILVTFSPYVCYEKKKLS